MKVSTATFYRRAEPDALHEAIAAITTEVNAFLADKDLNNILDVRWATGMCVADASDRQDHMFHLAHVIFLE